MVKTYYGTHNYDWAFENNKVTYKVLVKYSIQHKVEKGSFNDAKGDKE